LDGNLRRAGDAKKLVVIDAVYSMDADFAPLLEIVGLYRRHRALLMVDEAHSVGMMGKMGRGAHQHVDHVALQAEMLCDTLSKTIPSIGGYIAGKQQLIDAVKYNARGWIFSGALPPPQVDAASAALDVMTDEPERVEELRHNTRRYVVRLSAHRFDVHDGRTSIVPIQCTLRMNRTRVIRYGGRCASPTVRLLCTR
jgi:glycine C-acetyltransferase